MKTHKVDPPIYCRKCNNYYYAYSSNDDETFAACFKGHKLNETICNYCNIDVCSRVVMDEFGLMQCKQCNERLRAQGRTTLMIT